MEPGLAIVAEQWASAAADFAAYGRARIQQALSPASAAALHRHLDTELPWSRVFNRGEQTIDLGPESIVAMKEQGDAPLLAAVHDGARDGFQFLFDSVRISDDPHGRAARGLLLDHMLDALNAPASLATFRAITGMEDITRVDGQATRYLPGHFLTGHDDDVAGKDRGAAYVLSLTPHWRTEWGGLLQFHDDCGDVARALLPAFNTLTVFRVPQLHSVSLVAPFAGVPRYSITGWLRR